MYEIVRRREWCLHVGFFFIKESSSCATKWIIYKQQIITSLSYLQITFVFQLAGQEGILPEPQSLFIKLYFSIFFFLKQLKKYSVAHNGEVWEGETGPPVKLLSLSSLHVHPLLSPMGLFCCWLLCCQLECQKFSSVFTVALWHKDSREDQPGG